MKLRTSASGFPLTPTASAIACSPRPAGSILAGPYPALLRIDAPNPSVAQPHRNEAQHPKRRVDDPPPRGYAPKRAEHEGPDRDERAHGHPVLIEPPVPQWITQRSHERQRDREMPEGQPVDSIEHEGRLVLG